jgi:predicted transposase YbfD/YdcC
VTAKSNEIPAVQALLKLFDLTDVIVTVDAMHTQTDTAEQITTAGGDYVLTVKANQPNLFRACKNLPWTDVPSHHHEPRARPHSDPDHQGRHRPILGRIRRRHPDRPTTTHRHPQRQEGHRSRLPHHLRRPPPSATSDARGLGSRPLGIENRLHWIRDVTYDEDRSQVRTGNSPQIMATLRNTAISLLRLTGADNIAQRLRHHARDPETILNLLLTC